MNIAPSVSNSITVRLELPARATAVSELTTAIEACGGLVTGIFRGLLDAGTKEVSDDVLAAANALANIIGRDELNPTYIIPSVFNPDVTKVVAAAVRTAANSAMTPPAV